eukprot:Amastigsp_a340688_11.p3 type:complete len:108 gc:universal Amastigsp_a340688_11:558-235(-)
MAQSPVPRFGFVSETFARASSRVLVQHTLSIKCSRSKRKKYPPLTPTRAPSGTRGAISGTGAMRSGVLACAARSETPPLPRIAVTTLTTSGPECHEYTSPSLPRACP